MLNFIETGQFRENNTVCINTTE